MATLALSLGLACFGMTALMSAPAQAASYPSVVRNWPTLRYNSSGSAVKYVQKRLKQETDGWFGPQTRTAVNKYKKKHHLKANGVVGRGVWQALGVPHRVTAGPHQWPTLRVRSYGPAVKYVKKRLHAGTSSNWFGAGAAKAVKQFKKKHHLNADSIVGPRTWKALGVKHTKPKAPKNPKPGTAAFGKKVIAWAAKQKGKPYVWGAEGPNSFDCSGLAQYVYKHAVNIKLPRVSGDQMRATKRISKSQARPGDLVFVVHSGGSVSHTAIYAGGNMWWEASRPGVPVGKDRAWTNSVVYGRAR